MNLQTRKKLINICFYLMAASLLGIAVALRYSYEFDPEPIIKICVWVGLASTVLHIILRHIIKSD